MPIELFCTAKAVQNHSIGNLSPLSFLRPKGRERGKGGVSIRNVGDKSGVVYLFLNYRCMNIKPGRGFQVFLHSALVG